ncbi:hypothetical protein ACFE04_003899 [Oxalis oulophora]
MSSFNKRRAEGRDDDDDDVVVVVVDDNNNSNTVTKKKRNNNNLKLKLNNRKPTASNTISYVQVLGTGMDTQDTSPSVLLFFDNQRFIFNAGEGLQRFCTEHKIKLSKIDHIFLSRVCSETAGGLPGLLLTMAGIGEEGLSVNVWGPSDLKYLVDAMKSFIPHAAMVHTRSFGPASISDDTIVNDSQKFRDPIVLVDDEIVKISAHLLFPRSLEGSATKPGEMSVIYVCELPEVKGKFDVKKAQALGLKSGPKYSELQSGKSVKSDRQDIMVHPSDVLGPSVPGPIVLLVDCPTESHVDELLSTSLNNYYTDPNSPPECAKTVNCVIHLSPASVTNNSNYKKWMTKFGPAQHIMAGHEMKNVEIPILKSSARIAARLNYLCPKLFPFKGYWSLQHPDYMDSTVSSTVHASEYCETIPAENLLKFTLRPYVQLGLERSNIPSLTTHSEITKDLLLEIPEIVDAAKNVEHLWHKSSEGCMTPFQDDKAMVEEPLSNANILPSCLENIRRDDMEIVLLGTGSSQPSKYRNVSSIFINLFAKGSLLLDCGEGSLGQLKRRYGVEGADDAVRNLRCVWISHIHADHHAGLARILTHRRNLLKEIPHNPLIVVGPRQLKRFLDAYQRLEDLNMQFLDCNATTETLWNNFENTESNKENDDSLNSDISLFSRGSTMQSYWKSPVDNDVAFPVLKQLKKVLDEAGLDCLISFPVVHCPQSFGIVLKAAERINSVGKLIPGWKIVYSGDTRPCKELEKASSEATVLIHEATFEDGLMDEAIAKNHSTTKEAIDTGEKAGAYRTVLTHFSQRYPKIPVFDEAHAHNTCICFDLMSINMADLPVLPKVMPYIKLLFKDEMTVDDEFDEELGAVEA